MATVNASASIIPFWLKLAFTAFMFVLVPVYWANYGPTNFLYFCDLALFLVLAGIWTESPLLVSLPAVGILLPQMLWCLDFLVELCGGRLTGLTSYMSDPNRSLFLRGLSLFHGWLPFLVYYLVKKLGYDRRALVGWIAIATVVCLVAYFFLPPPGTRAWRPENPAQYQLRFRPHHGPAATITSTTRLSRCLDRVPHHHDPRADPLSAAEVLSAARKRTLTDKITWARRTSRACTPARSHASADRTAPTHARHRSPSD